MIADDVNIRTANRDDQKTLEELLYLSIYHAPGTPAPPVSVIDQPSIARYVTSWGRKGDLALIASMCQKVIGGIWMRFFSSSEPGYGFISPDIPEIGIAVKKEYRGQGVGSLLLRTLLEVLPEEVHALSLSVQLDNRALELYRRFGFKEYRVDGDSMIMLYEKT